MRDAFGGAFMIKLFIVFIMVYICFIAIAVNYAKAFKVKNKVIDYLENHEIVDLDKMNGVQETALEDFFEKEILGNMNYRVNHENICEGIKTRDESGKRIAYCSDIGIIIRQVDDNNETELYYPARKTKGVYYTVSTYIGWNAGFINNILALDNTKNTEDTIRGMWKISGQTRIIVNEE